MLALIADLLTLSRILAAGLLLWLGLQGPQTLPLAVVVSVVGWTTDQLDGWAARHADGPTRMAGVDFVVDTAFYAGTLSYMALAGFLPPLLVLSFAAAATLVILTVRRKAITVLFARMVDLAAASLVVRHFPEAALALMGWLLLLAAIYRRRLSERVPLWLGELARLAGWTRRTS